MNSASGHGSRALIEQVCGQFNEISPPPTAQPANGPISWEGYDAARARAKERTGESESVVCGTATIGSRRAVVIAFEFGFLGGSLSEHAGERLTAAHRAARAERLPVVSLVATGGSRMQEGMRALTQLQCVARESAQTRAAGLLQLAVLRDPTTGGGWATLGAGADVILACPGAQIGFAGSRVRPADADPRAYQAEGQLAAGQIDQLVRPEHLATTIERWLTAVAGGSTHPLAVDPPAALGSQRLPHSGWEAVTAARSARRPRATRYLDAWLTERVEISGDRCGGVDPGMRCGFGLREGTGVAYVAQSGTANTPAGFRTAARLLRLADRCGVPVLTLVDTPGAANDAEAERLGAGGAIAECFAALAETTVPVTTLVIGEGGSGGALALAAPGNTWVTPDSYFSVIAPELAAAILKRAPRDIERTADELRIRPQDLVELGMAEGVVSSASRP